MLYFFFRKALLPALVLPMFVCGQVTLVGPTYIAPELPRLAPGQIVTLAFSGLRSRFPEPVRAAGTPLPLSLSNISLTLRQSFGPREVPLPLLAISQTGCVDAAEPQCNVHTLITVQVPFELYLPPAGSLAPIAPALLVITERGTTYAPLRFLPSPDAVHIANTCDISRFAAANPCEPAVIHADGRPVSAASPARSGEVLTIFAYGLGRVRPAVATGSATPAGQVLLETPVSVRAAFGANLPPQRDAFVPKPGDPVALGPQPGAVEITFAGMSPDSVGLYQINVVVPVVPVDVPACGGSVASNLTLSVIAVASFDGAGICAVR